MRTLLVAVTLLFVIVVGGLAIANLAFDRTSVTTRTVTGDITEIVVRSDGGDVELVPARRDVTVRETQHYLVKKPTLEQDLADGLLTLDSHCDAYLVACHADLRVGVPAGTRVTVDADSGDVEARRIDVPGAHVENDSGDIRLRLVGHQQLLWAHADSGDVAAVAADARAVDAQSDSGGVLVATGGNPRRIVALTDSGDVTVAVRRGEYAVDAETDSGDVDIQAGISRNDRAPRSIHARTDSGDVTVKGG